MFPSLSLRPLTEDEFDLIAAESMFGQHLELQHLSEGDKRRWRRVHHGHPSHPEGTSPRRGTCLGGGQWDTHLGGALDWDLGGLSFCI